MVFLCGFFMKFVKKMSIQNAIQFITAYEHDESLRRYLGILETPDQRRAFLGELDMDFYDEEFEEAYNLLLVKCADEADHNVLSQVRLSYIELITE
jgi:CRISPR/Cas system-associated protein Cas5 (RAMP superfamily)